MSYEAPTPNQMLQPTARRRTESLKDEILRVERKASLALASGG